MERWGNNARVESFLSAGREVDCLSALVVGDGKASCDERGLAINAVSAELISARGNLPVSRLTRAQCFGISSLEGRKVFGLRSEFQLIAIDYFAMLHD